MNPRIAAAVFTAGLAVGGGGGLVAGDKSLADFYGPPALHHANIGPDCAVSADGHLESCAGPVVLHLAAKDNPDERREVLYILRWSGAAIDAFLSSGCVQGSKGAPDGMDPLFKACAK